MTIYYPTVNFQNDFISGLPAKLQEIHVMNVVSFFDKILSLIRPFMRAEIFKMVQKASL